MKKTARYSAIAAIIPVWLLFVAIPISAAQGQDSPRRTRTALACGQELKRQCTSVPVQANNMCGTIARRMYIYFHKRLGGFDALRNQACGGLRDDDGLANANARQRSALR